LRNKYVVAGCLLLILVVALPVGTVLGNAGIAKALLPSFNRGLVSVTFDDSWEGQYTNALPALNARGIPATMFTTTSFVDSDPSRLTTSQLHDFQNSGSEIASHMVTHVDPTTLTPAELNAQLADSKAWLEARFGPVYDYASPYGAYNATTIAAIKNYYLSQRTVDDGYNSISNFDQYTLQVKHLFNTTTPAEVAGWIAQAKADKTWLILVFHQVDPDTSLEPYGVTPTDFDSMMQAIQTSGVPGVTTKQALDELLPYFQQYTVVASVGHGQGTVSPTTQAVDYGSTASLSITPAQGFRMSSITDNGVAQPLRNPYVIRNVTANHAVTVSFSQPVWYLAEGSTAWGFSDYISIENPNAQAVAATITYMPSEGTHVQQKVTLPASSQTTVDPSQVIGQTDFSTVVAADDTTKTIAVDRTMSWTGQGAASPEAHNSIGTTVPSTTWFLPEGSSNWGFETWILVENVSSVDAAVKLTYMIEGAAAQTVNHSVNAHSRATFSMADDIGTHDASVMVSSSQPAICELSMYRNSRREGHCSIGAMAPSPDFYLAEGTTAYGFTSYILVQNPNRTPAGVTITYMTPAGPRPQAVVAMPPSSRMTIRVNDVAGMGSTDFSTRVHSSQPIVAERSMYWGAGTTLGEAGHDSIGVPGPSADFYLPDGQTSDGRETFTLVQNPGAASVALSITYLPADGGPSRTLTDTVPANSRRTYNMEDLVASGRAATLVHCLSQGGRVIVERSMYWNGRGAGTNTVGAGSD
jgi:peptidoglycan/xylan/chitin deacetylase (PgdA/CDA1 family)